MTWQWCGRCGAEYNSEEDHECAQLYICPICGDELSWSRDGVKVILYSTPEGFTCWHGEGEPENEPYVILHIKPVSKSVADRLWDEGGLVEDFEIIK
jgi:DNA-directed RNA polymerase subunit RPC12/RpoP